MTDAFKISWKRPDPVFRVRFLGPDGSARVEHSTQPPEPVITYIGPSGADGGFTAPFEHVQNIASAEWIINHNLGFYPSVTVLSPAGVEVEAQVQNISVNEVRVYFNLPYIGRALVR